MTLLGNASEGRVTHHDPLRRLWKPGVPAWRRLRGRLNANPARWSVPVVAEMGVAVALAAVLARASLHHAAGRFGEPRDAARRLRGRAPRPRPGVATGAVLRAAAARPAGGVHLPPAAGGCSTTRWPSPPWALAGLVRVGGWRTLGRPPWPCGCCGARFVFHFLSGLMFFATYAPAWEAPWLYSITYNLLYLVPEAVLTSWSSGRCSRPTTPPSRPSGCGRAGAGAERTWRDAVVFLNGEYEDRRLLPALVRGRRAASWPPTAGRPFSSTAACTRTCSSGTSTRCRRGSSSRRSASGVEIVRLPVRKDRPTPSWPSTKPCAGGAGELVLVGALGRSLDHTFGNVTVLRRLAAAGMPARIAAPEMTVRCLAAGATATLSARPKTRVSLLALGDRARVTLRGFDYQLTEGEIARRHLPGHGQPHRRAPADRSPCTPAPWPSSSPTAARRSPGRPTGRGTCRERAGRRARGRGRARQPCCGAGPGSSGRAVMLVWAVIPVSWLLGHATAGTARLAHHGGALRRVRRAGAGLVVLAARPAGRASPARPWACWRGCSTGR